MKVAIVVNELNICGGTHKQILRLCQYLEKKGVSLVICTKYYAPHLTYPQFQKYEILYLKSEPTVFFNSKGSIKNKIRNQYKIYSEQKNLYRLIPVDIDIINVHDNGLEYVIHLAKKDCRKVVFQINDLPLYFRVGVHSDLSDNIKYKIHRYVYKKMIKHVDIVTVNVTKNKECVKRCLDKDAIVLYCGVDNNPKLKMHTQLQKERPYHILSTGVFYPYRNYETLINVTEILLQKGLEIHLDIMGATETSVNYADSIKKLIDQKALSDNVTVWGQVNDDTYIDLFGKTDIFVFVNINQSWGLAVFEAMSCGIPTIVSNSVGAIELLHDESDALIVEPRNEKEVAEKICKLIEEPNYYFMLSRNAASVVKNFTWDRLYCSKALEIFTELCKN